MQPVMLCLGPFSLHVLQQLPHNLQSLSLSHIKPAELAVTFNTLSRLVNLQVLQVKNCLNAEVAHSFTYMVFPCLHTFGFGLVFYEGLHLSYDAYHADPVFVELGDHTLLPCSDFRAGVHMPKQMVVFPPQNIAALAAAFPNLRQFLVRPESFEFQVAALECSFMSQTMISIFERRCMLLSQYLVRATKFACFLLWHRPILA